MSNYAQNNIKIVVLGRHNAGKTTFMEQLLGNVFKVEHNGNTIAMDYGKLVLGSRTLHFFGTPGEERFDCIREVVMEGMKGAILVVDSTRGIGECEIKFIKKLKEEGIPFVIAWNKLDINNALRPPDIGVPVIPAAYKKGIGVRETVKSLISLLTSSPGTPSEGLQGSS